ncbi:MAG TPA: AAA family ATPase [Defluviitoga tunisiensis]|nr:AAA family ATPase [Defluviitoga tunisiensis]HPP10899.1 AAA family ATPase [Defluviitoga tunisiensis]
MGKKEFILFNDGANWVKADFHLHSPYVHSFTLLPGADLSDIDKLVDLYIEKLKKREIKIAAITDYQQIRKDFFKKLQSKAVQNGIYIFPGVELSVNYGKGLHILLIFEYNQDIDGINDYIKALDQNPHENLIKNDRSHRDISLQRDLKLILEEIKSKFNCLLIYPHPNDKNGLLNSFQPKEAAEFLIYADAIEFIDESDKNRIISTGVLDKSFFTNLAVIENTDPKSLDEIGSKQRDNKIRTTYLKLSSASINAFKLALHDPSLRVSVYNKPIAKKDRIVSVKINGTSFLKNIKIQFNSDLNTFIGGRGVGKSAILEAIRYCLDLPVYSDKEYREYFVKNVVGSGGVIEIEIERFFGDVSITDKVKRVIGQLPEVENKNIPPIEVFGDNTPLILGQKELYALSLKDDFQLLLIDNLIGDELKKEDVELKKLINNFEENARELLTAKKNIQKKDEVEQELKTINEHLKMFEQLGVADKMAKQTALIQDEKKLKQAIEQIQNQINNGKQFFEETISEIEKQVKLLQEGKSVEKNILSNTSDIFSNVKQYFEGLKKDFEIKTKDFAQQIEKLKKQWEEQKKKYDNEIISIKQELSAKGLAPDKYEALVKRKTQLEPLLKEYQKVNSKITELEKTRNELKSQLKQKRHQLFEIRKNKLEELNNKLHDKLKIEIGYLSNKEKFKEDLTELLKGSGISRDAINNIIEKEAIDGIEISKLISLEKDKVIEELGLTDAMAQRFINWFSDNEKLYKIENLFPEDKIIIKLKIDDTYKDLNVLSAGQKATALLILLFAQEDRILIIDQPEEDLDNRFIYEDVVKILREIKNNRQIILVTHNANIPVLGDAEQVFVLDASNNECSIMDTGSIDKNSVAQNIKSIMEGGEEAFKRRIEKYGVNL